MLHIKFHIFGVPDGFNLLSGTTDEILYYQLFYDTTKKGCELRVNRQANGSTVYSYSVYNLVSCKGRAGAFLGMSVVFTNGEYCNNIEGMAELFSGVYNEVVLKDGVLLTKSANDVVRFCVSKFSEQADECDKIGQILVNNIENELASSIVKYNNSFSNGKEGRVRILPLSCLNEQFIAVLKDYSWISLSSEYIQKETLTKKTKPVHGRTVQEEDYNDELLAPDYIKDLSGKIVPFKDFIINVLKGLENIEELKKKIDETNKYLDTLEKFVIRQPSLKQLKNEYFSIYQDLINLSRTMIEDVIINNNSNNGFKKIIGFVISHAVYFLMGVLSVAVVVSFVLIINDKDEKTEESTELANSLNFDKDIFNKALRDKRFQDAYKQITLINNENSKKYYLDRVSNKYSLFFNDTVEKIKKDTNKLSLLKDGVKASALYNREIEQHLKIIDNYINYIRNNKNTPETGDEKVTDNENVEQKKKNPVPDKANVAKTENKTSVVYKANDKYAKYGNPLGNIIECKINDYFIIEGTNSFQSTGNGLQVAKSGEYLRIHPTAAGKIQLTINEKVKITFNVKR